MTYARRVDANHAAIVRELEQAKVTVKDLSRAGAGWPDLFVARREVGFFVEVKSRGGKLTPEQRQFISDFPRHVIVATCAEDVISELDVREFGE